MRVPRTAEDFFRSVIVCAAGDLASRKRRMLLSQKIILSSHDLEALKGLPLLFVSLDCALHSSAVRYFLLHSLTIFQSLKIVARRWIQASDLASLQRKRSMGTHPISARFARHTPRVTSSQMESLDERSVHSRRAPGDGQSSNLAASSTLHFCPTFTCCQRHASDVSEERSGEIPHTVQNEALDSAGIPMKPVVASLHMSRRWSHPPR